MLKDEGTRRFIKWRINEETAYREVIKTDEHKYFFHWSQPQVEKLKGGFNSLICILFSLL
jgi:hypothetical protein